MSKPDLNLLVALDVLLEQGSVVGAARKLRLSPSAMSRTLARLREATGDPLLVRAGRALVPTPRALELGGRVGRIVEDAEEVLRPVRAIEPRKLDRTFTLRTSEGFVETFGPRLLARIGDEAPRVRLRFLPKPQKDSEALRSGSVDLETGVVDETTGPELRTQALFRDRLVGVVRAGHPLSRGPVTASRYAKGKHVSVSRVGAGREPIDEALAAQGLEREVVAVLAGGFAAAIALARHSDLVASVPEKHTAKLRDGMHTFSLPVAIPDFTVSLLFHPRMEADAAHRWLRARVCEVVAAELGAPHRQRAGGARRGAERETAPRPRRR